MDSKHNSTDTGCEICSACQDNCEQSKTNEDPLDISSSDGGCLNHDPEYRLIKRSDEQKKELISWINRITGSLNGVAGMINEDKYCHDILIQLSAAQKSITSLANKIIEGHLKSCVVQRIKNGDLEVLDEIIQLFKRFQ